MQVFIVMVVELSCISSDANSPGSKTDQPESSPNQAKVDKAKGEDILLLM